MECFEPGGVFVDVFDEFVDVVEGGSVDVVFDSFGVLFCGVFFDAEDFEEFDYCEVFLLDVACGAFAFFC